MSPVTHVAKGKYLPAFLILHVADNPLTGAQAQRLFQVLQEAGVSAKVVAAEGKTHGTINSDLGLPDDKPTQALWEFLKPWEVVKPSNLVRLGKPGFGIWGAEVERSEKTSKIRLGYDKVQIGSLEYVSTFMVLLAYEIAKAQRCEYFVISESWTAKDDSWMYAVGFTNKPDADIKQEFGEKFSYKNALGQERMLSSVSQYALIFEVARQSTRITAEALGLPKSNQRTSEPFVVRIYKADDNDNILTTQPEGYAFTIHQDYDLKDNEKPRVHAGVEIQSSPNSGELPRPLEFKAGVHGVVIKTGIGNFGIIAVKVWDGSVLEFLNTSKSLVELGDVVAPDTPLGVTGKTGAGTIHLQVQAKNSSKKPISPDLVFRIGQHPLQSSLDSRKDWRDWGDFDLFDPNESNAFEVRKEGRKVFVPQLPKTKWIVEVIGTDGTVEEALGEFWSCPEALAYSSVWSRLRPNDMRPTREREVPISSK